MALHPLELAALWAIGAHLVFLPWALGTMPPWAQWTSLAFSLLGFVLAMLPRNYTEEHTGANAFRLLMWPKLARFPIFWIGLALLALVVVQALNPAWQYNTDGKLFWMRAIPHNESLPHGVIAPFEQWNQWRMLVIYSSTLLTVCSIWVAFTRRRTVQYLLVVLVSNGLLLALFGIAQRLLGNGQIFWFYNSVNPFFFASFIYKNHGGAYFDLILAVTCGLAGWHYVRGFRRLEKSNPSAVLAFFATCIAIAIFISYARGATLVMLAFLIPAIGGFLIHQFQLPKENRKPIVAILLVLVFGFFLKTGLESLQSKGAWERLRQGVMRQDLSLELREKATAAALELLGENWKTGIGAGDFRYVFPIVQYRHPDLVRTREGVGMFWEHAHNDVVQIPAELGIIGVALLAAGMAYWAFTLLRSRFWRAPLSACLVLGLGLLMIYSWWDFPFQCPAILITFCALWPSAALWARFEESGGKT